MRQQGEVTLAIAKCAVLWDTVWYIYQTVSSLYQHTLYIKYVGAKSIDCIKLIVQINYADHTFFWERTI